MDEGRSLGCAASGDSSSRFSSSVEKVGDRTRFTVELRPAETTIVSWKKLTKDVSKANAPAPAPPATALVADRLAGGGAVHPALESRLAPAQAQGVPDDLNNAAAPSNRMSAVIEKIERLYMGKDSSEDEDLGDTPDDDQYDTEDSFIDDAELDEYFEVDKLKTKHDGFFVNRGKLESIEPSLSPNQLPKKRRRKAGENDFGNAPKQMKVGRKGGGGRAVSVGNDSISTTTSTPVEGDKHLNGSATCNQKPISDGNKSLYLEDANINLHKSGVLADKSSGNCLKEVRTFSDSVPVKHHERNGSLQPKNQSGKKNYLEGPKKSIQQKEKIGSRELFDLNVACGAQPIQTAKTSLVPRKEGSSSRPKGNMLDKAIRELEKMVSEFKPRNGNMPDVDATSQGMKRRLPREIKQKLAKVARAIVSHGKITTELLSRLMNIVGHLINVRTLKRNLKILINTSISANQEKDNKFQQIKRDIVDMIKMRPPPLTKGIEYKDVSSDDFQESGPEEKTATKVKFRMDAAMEDKICDLYDIFVDGLDEDAAPQVRRLYAELAELWPKGVMDNHGIQRAICHAKNRRKTELGINKDQEKIRRKKIMSVKVEETVGIEARSAAQSQHGRERVSSEFGAQVPNCHSKIAISTVGTVTSSSAATTSTNVSSINPSLHGPTTASIPKSDRTKHEKLKASVSGSHGSEMRALDGELVKKVRRKPEINLEDAHSRPEKGFSHNIGERHKSHKHHSSGHPQKTSFQSASIPSFEQLS